MCVCVFVDTHYFFRELPDRGNAVACVALLSTLHGWEWGLIRAQDSRYCRCFPARPCRIAIEHQAALVPVLALGEALQLRNLYDMPALQQYTYRRLGFPGEPYVAMCVAMQKGVLSHTCSSVKTVLPAAPLDVCHVTALSAAAARHHP